MKDLYYIRGILRNRFYYLNDWKCLQMLEDAHRHGVSIEILKDIALLSKNWTEWSMVMGDLYG